MLRKLKIYYLRVLVLNFNHYSEKKKKIYVLYFAGLKELLSVFFTPICLRK